MLATTLFLGGWRAPWPLSLWDSANQGYWPVLWFLAKVLIFIFFFIWLRGTLPRLRYDQFMKFGWKVLIPVALVWIIAVGTIRTISLEGTISRSWLIGAAAVALVVFLVLGFVGESTDELPDPTSRPSSTRSPVGIPVPPMPEPTRRHQHPWGDHPWLDLQGPVLGPDRGFRGDVPDHVQEGRHGGVPLREEGDGSSLPWPPPAQPVAGRPGEVHRL